jgi:hypothetical protein
LVDASAVPAPRITEMTLDEVLDELGKSATNTAPFGSPSKEGFIEEIARAVEANFEWSVGIADDAIQRPEWSRDIWSAFVRGWSSAHISAQWETVLRVLQRTAPVYREVPYELATLLKGSLERKDGGLPAGDLNAASHERGAQLSRSFPRHPSGCHERHQGGNRMPKPRPGT